MRASQESLRATPSPRRTVVRRLGLVLGPALAVLVYVALPESYRGGDGKVVELTHAGHATAALAAWMATWWLTEAIDIPATALLPVAVLPVVGAGTLAEATAPYAEDLIFLFLGGFVLALSLQRWGLDRRIALVTLRLVGTRPTRVVGGLMVASAVMSMWVSNTATVAMMVPIALSVVGASTPDADASVERPVFATCLLLGVAYAASIGGLGTIIGSPPNVLAVSFIRESLGREISFVRWMTFAVPLVAVFLPLAWLLLTRVLYRVGHEGVADSRAVRDAYRALGPPSFPELVTFVVFLVTATAWILRPVLNGLTVGAARPLGGLNDAGIAVLAALALFVAPARREHGERVMDWTTARALPWGTLILFGGGLSLAAAIQRNGVGNYLGTRIGGLDGIPPILVVLVVTALVLMLTELTSNTATIATLLPILAALAPGLGVHPLALIVPATLGASCAFMMPVATPPNAIVFGSGHVTLPQMVRAGVWFNLLGLALVTSATFAVALPLLHVRA